MIKVKKSSELLWLLGLIFVAAGVATCSKADLGVSMIAAPTFVIHEAISNHFPRLSVGVTEYLVQGFVLIIMCLVIRKFRKKYILAFAAAIVYGYILNFFTWILRDFTASSVISRWIMLIVGDILTATGVACFFKTYMPLQVYELFVSELSKTFRFNINKVKWIFDITLLVISAFLAVIIFKDVSVFDWSKIYMTSFHNLGLGTLITTIINSPIIAFVGIFIDKLFEPTPLFPKLNKIIGKEQ